MCPATIALVGVGLTAGGAVVGGISQANAASYQGKVAANNATISQNNARHASSAAAANTEQAGLKARANNAQYRASQGALGVDVNSGSLADAQTSNRELSALDTATIANNDALQVYGYKTQAAGYQAQSKLDRSQVAPDIIGGVLKGAGTALGSSDVDSGLSSLLSGAPSVPSGYEWMQSPNSAGEAFANVG